MHWWRRETARLDLTGHNRRCMNPLAATSGLLIRCPGTPFACSRSTIASSLHSNLLPNSRSQHRNRKIRSSGKPFAGSHSTIASSALTTQSQRSPNRHHNRMPHLRLPRQWLAPLRLVPLRLVWHSLPRLLLSPGTPFACSRNTIASSRRSNLLANSRSRHRSRMIRSSGKPFAGSHSTIASLALTTQSQHSPNRHHNRMSHLRLPRQWLVPLRLVWHSLPRLLLSPGTPFACSRNTIASSRRS